MYRVEMQRTITQIAVLEFEDVAKEYPGAFRPFMIAWCDEFGGI
ncbi:MAG: hypothetical protein WC455_21210 [Dehalococcoidia bacterium]